MGGVSFIFHDETKVNRLIEEAKVGADVIGVGDDTGLADARMALGEDFCLSGNVDPVRVLLQGSPEEVTRTVKKCIQDAGKNGGFILNTGECVCRDTPPKNLETFVQTARESNPLEQ